MFYLKCATLSSVGKEIAAWESAALCVCGGRERQREHPCVCTESQMNLALSVLLKTAHSQNLGHAQHVSLYLFILIPPCISSCVCVFLLCLLWPRMSVALSVCVACNKYCCSDQSSKSFHFCIEFLHFGWIQGCTNRWLVCLFCCCWSDCIFFPPRGLNQSGSTLVRILAKYWLLCWQSTLPHKVRVWWSLSLQHLLPTILGSYLVFPSMLMKKKMKTHFFMCLSAPAFS